MIMFNFKKISRAAAGAAALALSVMGSTSAMATTGIFAYSNEMAGFLNTNISSISDNYVQGWAADTEGSNGGPNGNTNYISGVDINGDGTGNYNNYFVFDISSLTAPVTSAALHVYTETIFGSGTYSIVDASRLASQLYNTSVTGSSLYTALAQGTQIGSFAFNDGQSGQWIDVTFDSAGLAALNSRIAGEAATFAVSGTVGPVGSSGPTAPAPLAGGGVLAALAAAIALLVTRGRGFLGGLPAFRKLGTA